MYSRAGRVGEVGAAVKTVGGVGCLDDPSYRQGHGDQRACAMSVSTRHNRPREYPDEWDTPGIGGWQPTVAAGRVAGRVPSKKLDQARPPCALVALK